MATEHLIEELKTKFAVDGDKIIIPILKFDPGWDEQLLGEGYECHAQNNKVVVTAIPEKQNPGKGRQTPNYTKEEIDRLIELGNRGDLTVKEIAKEFPNREVGGVRCKLSRLRKAGKIKPRWKRQGRKTPEISELERLRKELEKARAVCMNLEQEAELLAAFDKQVDDFHSEFMKVAPFGRGGSDKHFAEIAETFLQFREKWHKWWSKKKDKMLREALSAFERELGRGGK